MQDTTSDLQQFHTYVGQQLGNGSANLSPEECLELWRVDHPRSDDFEQSLAAVNESLAELARGKRGRPASEHIEELRKKHQLPAV